MPFGYKKYTEEGRQYWAAVVEREKKKIPVIELSVLIDTAIQSRSKNEQEWVVLGEMGNEDTGVEMRQERSIEFVNVEQPEEREKRLLNEKAARFARALVAKSKDRMSNARILEGLQFELERCVRQGADVDAIHDILASA